MITVVVNFDLPPGTTLADATARFQDSSQKYLGAPRLTYFESPVVVDNVAGEIVS